MFLIDKIPDLFGVGWLFEKILTWIIDKEIKKLDNELMMRMQCVPPAHRFIEAMSVGLMFGDITQIKCPGDEWINAADAARYVAKKSKNFVAYRRFVYDQERGKVYMDPGWVYFKGDKIANEDIISREAEKKFPGMTIGKILMDNMKYNELDVMWFREQGKFYPFDGKDVFVDINERRKS